MFAEPKRKPRQGDSVRKEGERRHKENALDEALKDTFRRPTRFHSSNRSVATSGPVDGHQRAPRRRAGFLRIGQLLRCNRPSVSRVLWRCNMTAAESRKLKKGHRVCWRGDTADSGTITETSWHAVTIAWDNGQVAAVHHGDMREIQTTSARPKAI